MDKVYWVAINRLGKAEGGYRHGTPHLYLGKRAAMNAKRAYEETDEELLKRYTFKPVKIVVQED